jgi:HAD superfamily hydrolase (TIGR01509 family)
MKKLVIFDMDGVLLNSEPLYRNTNRAVFKELGADITPEEQESFTGAGATRLWTFVKNRAGAGQSVEELIALAAERKYQQLSQAELTPTEGITEVLKHLKHNGHLLAIASSGLKRNISVILHKLDMEQYFDLIVSGDEIPNGKPDPDIFLAAASYLNMPPSACIVVEDSTNGVAAAKAAGMYCIGYRNPGSGNQDLSKADRIIDRFEVAELAAALGI